MPKLSASKKNRWTCWRSKTVSGTTSREPICKTNLLSCPKWPGNRRSKSVYLLMPSRSCNFSSTNESARGNRFVSSFQVRRRRNRPPLMLLNKAALRVGRLRLKQWPRDARKTSAPDRLRCAGCARRLRLVADHHCERASRLVALAGASSAFENRARKDRRAIPAAGFHQTHPDYQQSRCLNSDRTDRRTRNCASESSENRGRKGGWRSRIIDPKRARRNPARFCRRKTTSRF